jgi:hypothetical protein
MSGIGGYSDEEFARNETRWSEEDELKAAGFGHLIPGYTEPTIPTGYTVKSTRWPQWYRVTSPIGDVFTVNLHESKCSCKHRGCIHLQIVEKNVMANR